MNEELKMPYEAKPAREMAYYIINQLRDGGSYPGAKSMAYVEHLCRAALAASGVAAPVNLNVLADDLVRVLNLDSLSPQATAMLRAIHNQIAGTQRSQPVAADAPAEVAIGATDERTNVRRFVHKFFARQSAFPMTELHAAYAAIDRLAAPVEVQASHWLAGDVAKKIADEQCVSYETVQIIARALAGRPAPAAKE